jgi:hypothetical protein
MWKAMILHTTISIDECRARLASVIDAERWSFSLSGYLGSKPILGKICGDDFRLQKRIYYHNGFRPFFYGRLIPSDNGTLIEGEFRMQPFTRWFMILWFSFFAFLFIIFIAIVLVSLAMGRAVIRDNIVLLLGPCGMMAFGIFLIKFSWWLCRGDEKAIIALLKGTLEASE